MDSPSNGVDLSVIFEKTYDGLPYVLTRAGCYDKEDNDCAIVALALAADLPYGVIHDLAKVCLRRGDKEPTLNMILACQFYPFRFRKVNKKRHRLISLPRLFPKGRYYIQIGGRNNAGKHTCHALALIDGKFYDRHPNTPHRWVTGVWKIEGLKADNWWGWKKYLTLGRPAPG